MGTNIPTNISVSAWMCKTVWFHQGIVVLFADVRPCNVVMLIMYILYWNYTLLPELYFQLRTLLLKLSICLNSFVPSWHSFVAMH